MAEPSEPKKPEDDAPRTPLVPPEAKKQTSGGRLTLWLLGIVCVAGLVALIGKTYIPELGKSGGSTASRSDAGAGIGGPFTLVNQFGETVTDQTYSGKYLLIYFGYTYCPDVCPTALTEMANAIDLLGTRGASIQPIFITVDPDRDTAEQLKTYTGYFHPGLVGLTGTPEQIDKAAKAYRVYYRKNEPSAGDAADYMVDHTSIIYFVGPNGRLVTHFSHGTTAEKMAERIGKLL